MPLRAPQKLKESPSTVSRERTLDIDEEAVRELLKARDKMTLEDASLFQLWVWSAKANKIFKEMCNGS